MNVSLYTLSVLLSMNESPFICSRMPFSLNMFHISFKKSFSALYYSQNVHNMQICDSTFHNTLKVPIFVSETALRIYESYSEFGSSGTIIIQKCRFVKCNSISAAGSCFHISAVSACYLIVDSCVFQSCICTHKTSSMRSDLSSSAFLFVGTNFSLKNGCFMDMYGNGWGFIFYSRVPNNQKNLVNNVYAINCSSSSTGFGYTLDYGDSIVENYNATRIVSPGDSIAGHYGGYESSWASLRFSQIHTCSGNSLTGPAMSPSLGPSDSYYINIINNTANYMIISWLRQFIFKNMVFSMNTGAVSGQNDIYLDSYFDNNKIGAITMSRGCVTNSLTSAYTIQMNEFCENWAKEITYNSSPKSRYILFCFSPIFNVL